MSLWFALTLKAKVASRVPNQGVTFALYNS